MVMDNMVYTTKGYISKNRILTNKGWQYLTVPLIKPNGFQTKINELIIENRAFADLLYKMTDKDAMFEGGELEQVRAHIRRMANVWGAAENSYNAGLLPEQTYNLIYDDMRNLFITYPASRDAWREILELYPTLKSGFFGYSRELLRELENAEK